MSRSISLSTDRLPRIIATSMQFRALVPRKNNGRGYRLYIYIKSTGSSIFCEIIDEDSLAPRLSRYPVSRPIKRYVSNLCLHDLCREGNTHNRSSRQMRCFDDISRRITTRSAEEKGRENPTARIEKRIVLIKTHNWSNAISYHYSRR